MVFSWLSALSVPDLIIELSLLLLIIFTPLPKGTFIGWPVVVVHVLSYIMLISWIVKMKGHKSWRLIKTPVDFLVIFFFILAVASFSFSLDYGKSFVGVLKLLDCLIIFYVVANNIDREEKVKVIIYSIILVGAFISIFGLIQFVGGIGHSWWVTAYNELCATFENSNFFAAYLAIIIPLAISMLFNKLEIGQRVIVFYLLIIMIVAFILSLSRGGWISLLPAIVVMGILFLYKFRINKELINIRWFAVLPLFFIITSLIIILGFSHISNQISVTIERDYKTLNGRIYIWKNGLGIVEDYPFLGAGIDVFTSFKSPIPASFKNIDSDHDYMGNLTKFLLSHYDGYDGLSLWNQYLQIGAEMGTPALLCFILLIIQGIYGSIKVYNQKRSIFKQSLCLGIIGGVIATLIHMLSANILNFMSNSILLSILMGIIFGKYCQGRGKGYFSIS